MAKVNRLEVKQDLAAVVNRNCQKCTFFMSCPYKKSCKGCQFENSCKDQCLMYMPDHSTAILREKALSGHIEPGFARPKLV
jgi:hypothetical protein